MAFAVDAGGKVRANPISGKVINPKPVSPGPVLPKVQTAATPSALPPSVPAQPVSPSDVMVQTSSIPVPVANTMPRNPSHISANRPKGLSFLAPARMDELPDLVGSDPSGQFTRLSGGSVPSTETEWADREDLVSLPDLTPMIRDAMTKPDSNAVSMTPMSGGAVPSIGADKLEHGDTIDLPDLDPIMESVREKLGDMMAKPSGDQTALPEMSGGQVPSVSSDAIAPSEPKDLPNIELSFDKLRDWLDDVIVDPSQNANDTMDLPSLGTGATPTMSPDDIGTSGKNIFEKDAMWDLIGDTDTNKAYIRDAIDNGGLSKSDAKDIMGRGSWIEQLNKKYSQPLALADDMSDNRETLGDITVIDDGTVYDYDHMTSDTMTGTQYMHYAEMGMGGRPIEQIDPTKTYSKRREHINYDFTPFVPDQTAYANMIADNVMDVPHRLGTMLGGLRETITPDYAINYDGGSISGRDFDKLSTAYLNQFYYNDRFNPKRFLTKPDDNDNVTALVREYAVPDKDGNETYHYGRLTTMWANGDGTYTAEFSDGSSVDVSQEYLDSISNGDGSVTMTDSARVPASQARGTLPADLDSLNDVDSIMTSAQESGGSPLDYADVIYIPDLVLSDGTSIPYSDVERIYWDKTPGNDEGPGDDDISYEFKRFGIGPLSFDNRPRRLNQQEMFKSNGRGGLDVDLSDIGNNAVDWTLGSLPISIGSTMPWVYSASGATSSLAGVDPASYDPVSDSYGLIAGKYDKKGRLRYGVTDADGKIDDVRSDSTRWWNAAGNAAVPLTEMLVGPVGEQLVPLERIFHSELPSNPTVWQVIKNALVGAAGEGVEEDLGNIFDEITQYGPSGMFANQVTDTNGEALRDMYGHEVRDYGTNAEDRLNSFFDPGELANAFAGGVTVDALMQMLPIAGQLVPAARRDAARRKTGVAQFVDPDEREDRITGFDNDINSLER